MLSLPSPSESSRLYADVNALSPYFRMHVHNHGRLDREQTERVSPTAGLWQTCLHSYSVHPVIDQVQQPQKRQQPDGDLTDHPASHRCGLVRQPRHSDSFDGFSPHWEMVTAHWHKPYALHSTVIQTLRALVPVPAGVPYPPRPTNLCTGQNQVLHHGVTGERNMASALATALVECSSTSPAAASVRSP